MNTLQKSKSDYDLKITGTDHGTYVLITDQNQGAISVTNDMDNVIIDLFHLIPKLRDTTILYRDSRKIWDGVRLLENGFEFYNVGKKSGPQAVLEAWRQKMERDNKPVHPKSSLIIEEVKKALGEHQHYFNLETSDVLVDDKDYFSMILAFQPLDIQSADRELTGKIMSLEFTITNDEDFALVTGEDGELSISFGNIYCQLYWGEALDP